MRQELDRFQAKEKAARNRLEGGLISILVPVSSGELMNFLAGRQRKDATASLLFHRAADGKDKILSADKVRRIVEITHLDPKQLDDVHDRRNSTVHYATLEQLEAAVEQALELLVNNPEMAQKYRVEAGLLMSFAELKALLQ